MVLLSVRSALRCVDGSSRQVYGTGRRSVDLGGAGATSECRLRQSKTGDVDVDNENCYGPAAYQRRDEANSQHHERHHEAPHTQGAR